MREVEREEEREWDEMKQMMKQSEFYSDSYLSTERFIPFVPGFNANSYRKKNETHFRY